MLTLVLQYADTGLVYACTALLRRLSCLLMPCMHCSWNGILSLYKKSQPIQVLKDTEDFVETYK